MYIFLIAFLFCNTDFAKCYTIKKCLRKYNILSRIFNNHAY